MRVGEREEGTGQYADKGMMNDAGTRDPCLFYEKTQTTLQVVRRRRVARRGGRHIDGGRRARVHLHRRGKRDGLVANHLAGAQVHEVGVDGLAGGALGALELNLRRLARVADFVGAAGHIVLARAIGRRARLAAQVVLEVDDVALDVGHGGAADDAELHPTLVAVLELDGVERVRKRAGALVELLLVRAGVVDEAVGTHCRGARGRSTVERDGFRQKMKRSVP